MKKSILVVDDEASISFALTHLMRAEGYDAETATTGAAALEQAQKSHPDLIMLDTSLPDRDGYDVCQALRSAPALGGTKIILLSANSREIEIEKGLAMGADRYLTKPFSLGLVVKTVRDLLTEESSKASFA